MPSGGTFIDTLTNKPVTFEGTHGVNVIGLRDDKIIVSSGGREYSMDVKTLTEKMKNNELSVSQTNITYTEL